MDNRDKCVKCPLYSPGAHGKTTNRREIGARKRRIICQNEDYRVKIEFKRIETRICYNKAYCKGDYTHCPYYRIIAQQ